MAVKRIRINEDLNTTLETFESMQNKASKLINLCQTMKGICDDLNDIFSNILVRATFFQELSNPNEDYNFAEFSDEEKEKIITYIEERLDFNCRKIRACFNNFAQIGEKIDDALTDIKQFDNSISGNM